MVADPGAGLRIAAVASPADVRALAALVREWAGSEGAPDEAGFVERFAAAWGADPAARGWLALCGERPVGLVTLAVVTSLPWPSGAASAWGYVTGLYVVPVERSRGIGSALLGHVRAWSATEGLSVLRVSAAAEAESVYRAAGFEAAARVMRLRLDTP